MTEVQTGTLTVEDGVVRFMKRTGQDGAALHHGTLAIVLTEIRKKGWQPDGELPPHRTTGRYTIKLRREVEVRHVNPDPVGTFDQGCEHAKAYWEAQGWEFDGLLPIEHRDPALIFIRPIQPSR